MEARPRKDSHQCASIRSRWPSSRSLRAAPLAAQTPNDVAGVTAVVERFHAALKTGDAAAASQLIADDALFLEAGGVETRSEYVTNHLPVDIEFEKAVDHHAGTDPGRRGRDAAWATSTSDLGLDFLGQKTLLA